MKKVLVKSLATFIAVPMLFTALSTNVAAEDDQIMNEETGLQNEDDQTTVEETSVQNDLTPDEETGILKVNDGKEHIYIGDIHGLEKSAVEVSGNSKLTIDGNITGDNEGIKILDNSEVTVVGGENEINSFTYHGIELENTASVTVEGDINATMGGVEILMRNPSEKCGKIDIKGTINGKYGIICMYEARSNDPKLFLPEINVYEINAGSELILPGNADRAFRKYVKEYLENEINYYIHKDENVTILGEPERKTVTRKDIIKVAVPDGYELEHSDRLEISLLDDGTYAVRLSDVKGGINLKAVIKAISEATDVKEEDVKVVVEDDSNSPKHEESVEDEGEIIVDDSSMSFSAKLITPASNSASFKPLVEGGKVPSQIISIKLGGYQVIGPQAIIDAVNKTPQGTSLRVEVDKVAVLTSSMIEAFEANPTIDVEFVFNYAGKKMRVVIPAGYDVKSLLDKNGYCGFLRMADILGSQIIEG